MAKTITLTRDNAHEIALPAPQGPRHRPLNYGRVIEGIEDALDRNNFHIDRARYQLSKPRGALPGTCMTGLIDIQDRRGFTGQERWERGWTIGILHDNMRRAGLRVLGGQTVFVCDNLMTHGDDIVLNRRHTEGLETMLPDMLNRGVEGFRERMVDINQYVQQLREECIQDQDVESLLLRMHVQYGLPGQFLKPIYNNYMHGGDEIERGTLWGVHNAVTRELRALPFHRRVHYTKAVDAAINLN